MRLTLERIRNSNDGLFGEIWLDDSTLLCRTVEKRWHDNKRKISCIPVGTYRCIKRTSSKYGHHWILQDVPNRDLILIHAANWSHELEGCIGVGRNFARGKDSKTGIEADMVTHSQPTMNMLREKLPDSFELEIVDATERKQKPLVKSRTIANATTASVAGAAMVATPLIEPASKLAETAQENPNGFILVVGLALLIIGGIAIYLKIDDRKKK
jgi:hypothetical protein